MVIIWVETIMSFNQEYIEEKLTNHRQREAHKKRNVKKNQLDSPNKLSLTEFKLYNHGSKYKFNHEIHASTAINHRNITGSFENWVKFSWFGKQYLKYQIEQYNRLLECLKMEKEYKIQQENDIENAQHDCTI